MQFLFLIQHAADLETCEWPCGSSLLPTDSLPIDGSVVAPGATMQMSTLYENASLLPYDISGPDVYSVDYGAESLQDLFNSLEELGSQNPISDCRDDLEGTGIQIRSRQAQQYQPNSDNLLLKQGTAGRRLRLQSSIRKVQFGSASDELSSTNDDRDKESTAEAKRELFYSMEEAISEKNVTNRDDLMDSGIKIRARQVQHSANKLFTQEVQTLSEFTRHNELQFGSISDGESGIRSNFEDKVGRPEVRILLLLSIQLGSLIYTRLTNRRNTSVCRQETMRMMAYLKVRRVDCLLFLTSLRTYLFMVNKINTDPLL